MTILERLNKYLTENVGEYPPEIRYFDGLAENNPFCTLAGEFKSDSIEGSISLFLKSKGY